MKIFTVEEINSQIKAIILNEFYYPVTIKGEVANSKIAPSGHQYFTLRDGDNMSSNSIKCVLFNNQSNQIVKDFEHHEVLVTGNVDLYKAYGNCQIKVIEIEEYGEGALKQAFEKTKAKLDKEGLFLLKKDIPLYPKNIGVITSPDSHAFQDVCSKIKTRYPISDIYLYPSLVQGKLAAKNIIKKIQKCNNDSVVDVILIVRGGGSLEDLMAFNDEDLARAIYNSKLPTITGIGHKPDITIADYVADVSMETPTAAAIHACPDKFDLIQRINEIDNHLKKAFKLRLNNINNTIHNFLLRIETFNPKKIIEVMMSENRRISNNLKHIIKNNIRNILDANKINNSRLGQVQKIINLKIKKSLKDYKTSERNLSKFIINILKEKKQQHKSLFSDLFSYNPVNMLKKGYSIIRKPSGEIIKNKDVIRDIKAFTAEFSDGIINIEKASFKK